MGCRILNQRRGNVVSFAAVLMVPVCGICALAIDVGYLSVVRAELQRSADAAVLAAAAELYDEEELRGGSEAYIMLQRSRLICQQFAASNSVGLSAPEIDTNPDNVMSGDLVYGHVAIPAVDKTLETGSPRFNAVRLKLRRDDRLNGGVATFFAAAIGHGNSNLSCQATAICEAGISGFRVTAGSENAKLLPFTLHQDAWNAAFQTGSDNYRRDPKTGLVTLGSDGIRECKAEQHLFCNFDSSC